MFVESSRPWADAMLHEIQVVENDYLTCFRVWRPDGLGGFDVGTNAVSVAKPELLRSTVTARDGVTYVYSGTDAQLRTASKAGEDDEDHEVTPFYLVGDLIEVRVLRHKTGVSTVDAQRAVLIDTNADGRQWAKVPDP